MPSRKVTVGVFAGSVVAVALYILDYATGIKPPADVVVGINTILIAIIQFLVPNAE